MDDNNGCASLCTSKAGCSSAAMEVDTVALDEEGEEGGTSGFAVCSLITAETRAAWRRAEGGRTADARGCKQGARSGSAVGAANADAIGGMGG